MKKTGIDDISTYFTQQGLFDRDRLTAHCEKHLVRMGTSHKLPHLAILHYLDQAIFDRAWTDFTLSCRGLVVDLQNRRILAIPFFKFFNLGEPTAPSYEELAALGAFEVTEKIDGSMGIAFYDAVTNKFYITTKGSLDSEHGAWATARFPKSLCDKRLVSEHTLMFEIIAKRFQIVVNYAEKGYAEGLYLVGVRDNATQRLWTLAEVSAFAEKHGLPTFRSYPMSSLEQVIVAVKELPYSDEGFVLRFTQSDELMVKVKSPEYLRVHRFLSNLDEKHLLEILHAGQEKDILKNLVLVAEEYRDEVVAILKSFQGKTDSFLKDLNEHFRKAPKTNRKSFALWVQSKVPKPYWPFLFKNLDGKPVGRKEIYEHFLKTRQYQKPKHSGFIRFREA